MGEHAAKTRTPETDPIWYMLAEEALRGARPMHRAERLAFIEGVVAGLEAAAANDMLLDPFRGLGE